MTVAFSRWPDKYVWSFQVTRLLGLAAFGGSDVTEVYETCAKIDPKDEKSWDREWLLTAQVVEERGRKAEAVGNWISARNFYQRACNYYRCAQFFLSPKDPQRSVILRKVDEVFQDAARYFEVPPERISIEYEGHSLPGYFFAVKDPVGTIFHPNGGDELSSENWFTNGRTFIEAGYNFLVYDHPGVGLSLEKGLRRREDSEHYLKPAVDYLMRRPEVDPDRLIVLGTSWGAYETLRLASLEKRLAAAVASSPAIKLDWPWLTKWMSPAFREYAVETVGAKDIDDLLTNPRHAFDLAKVLGQIECPLLVIQGEQELLVQPNPIDQFLRIYELAGSRNKKMAFVERGSRIGGVEHCQKDNVHVEHDIALNWLCSLGLGPRPKNAATTSARVAMPA